MPLTLDMLQAIDMRVASGEKNITAMGTIVTRTSTTDALVVFDGSQGPIPCKVSGAANPVEGDRVYIVKFGTWWTVIGAAPSRGVYQRIQEVTLTSIASAITFSNIPATYTNLKLIGTLRSDLAATLAVDMRLRCNGDSGSRYSYMTLDVRETMAGGAPSVSASAAASGFDWAATIPAAGSFGGTRAGVEITIFDYTNNVLTAKEMHSVSGFSDVGTAQHMHFRWGAWDATAAQAVTSVELVPSGGNFAIGSRIGLWGIS